MLHISPRLATIATKISPGVCVADIGTDHAYLPIYLVENAISSHVIGIDIETDPLLKAKWNVAKYQLGQQIELRLGNGLTPLLPEEIHTIVIAGMGGYKIVNILESDLEKTRLARKIILQPMRDFKVVMGWLTQHDFILSDKTETIEGRHTYFVIVATNKIAITNDCHNMAGIVHGY